MKNYFILLTLLFSNGDKTNAQTCIWEKAMGGAGENFGYDYGTSIAVDPESGSVYTIGSFEGSADFDPGIGEYFLTSAQYIGIFISKLDSSGNFLWAISYNLTIDNYFTYSIAFDPQSGNVYITGSLGYVGIFIAKLDGETGQIIWSHSFFGFFDEFDLVTGGYDIEVDPLGSGAVYTTGAFQGTVDFDPGPDTFNLTPVGYSDIFISKLDSSGNFVWAKSMGGMGYDRGWSIAVDTLGSGAVYTTGYYDGNADFDPGPDTFNLTSGGFFLSKLDNSGNFLLAKSIAGAVGSKIAVDISGSGNVYTAGYFFGTSDFDPGSGTFNLTSNGKADIFISKLDSSGNFLWAKSIGGANHDICNSMALDLSVSGEVYATGIFDGTIDFDPSAGTYYLTANGYKDIFISKLDTSGNFLGAVAVGGTDFEEGIDIAVNSSGNGDVYLVGYFYSPDIFFGCDLLINGESYYYDEWNHLVPYFASQIVIARLDGIAPPCTSIVTSTGDSGSGSLRDIIYCTSYGSTITFDPALTDQTITLTSGEIVINKNLNLSGLGILDLTITGNNASRIFHVLPGKNLDIENLSLKNATSLTNGGAIFSEGNLILENVLLQNNFENGIPKAMTVTGTALVNVLGNVEIKN